jgi:hypothetical protein
MVKIGVMWYPRKKEVIYRSVASIGEHDITVYPDGVKMQKETKYPSIYLGDNVGCFKHYYRVLKDLCESNSEYVAVFSDDVAYRHNWFKTLKPQLDRKDVGFVAGYVPVGLAQRYGWRKGWYELNKGWAGAWGGGYVFRREVALQLLEHPFIINHRDNYKANQQIDHAIPEAMFQMGLKQLYYCPSLMNHIGVHSTIGHSWRQMDKGLGW